MIKVTNLHKNFGEFTALNSVSLEVNDGEVVAVIGPSGSGKSTLLRCLNLLEQPDDGIIEIGDVRFDVKNHTKKDVKLLRDKTAMVFQHYNLFKNKTVLENVTEALILNKKMKSKDAKEFARKFLKMVNILDKADKYPVTLSGGQQQRVSIARALAVSPYAILLDEPTSALDPELVSEVLEVIKSIAEKNTTMIIVTHEMKFAQEVADKVVFMVNGNIIEEGTSKEVFGSPKNERAKQFLSKLDKD
ncbi:amino acid ABC transporter ATP-binding protein [Clostridium fermenticellae]|uniref:Amino acid ABC transporter ATP-binding protein n=1 Tax=Clostridium fermenticellae TaxID=2068654 RepID=A0A386H5A6_9CLOT|nr:amino acid ABC transporter ATP-binding protein [Clostridium fermenticellae]AYD40931.1 amino acid ABC transporter ATP-binding protein [Clostridium fermenticellae]